MRQSLGVPFGQAPEALIVHRTDQHARDRHGINVHSDVLSALNRLCAPDKILDYVVVQAGLLLDATASALYTLARDANALVLQRGWELPASFLDQNRIQLDGSPCVQSALAQNQPVVIPSLIRDPLNADLSSRCTTRMLLQSGCCTTLVVPVAAGGQIYGALLLYYVDTHWFTDEDIVLATAFGRKAAWALGEALHRTPPYAS